MGINKEWNIKLPKDQVPLHVLRLVRQSRRMNRFPRAIQSTKDNPVPIARNPTNRTNCRAVINKEGDSVSPMWAPWLLVKALRVPTAKLAYSIGFPLLSMICLEPTIL